MSGGSSILKENSDFLYYRLSKTLEGVSPEEAEWKPNKEAHNILWQLNHLSRITNLSFPRLLTGDKDWEPEGWPANYRDADIGVQKLLEDLKNGSEYVSELLAKLQDEDLETDTKYWGGTRKLKEGLFAYLAEVAHHKGQIAYIRGTYARAHRTKWKYP